MKIFSIMALAVLFADLLVCNSTFSLAVKSTEFNSMQKLQSGETSLQSSFRRSPSSKRKFSQTDFSSNNEWQPSRTTSMQDQSRSTQDLIAKVGISEISSGIHAQAQSRSHDHTSMVNLDLSLGTAKPYASHSAGNSPTPLSISPKKYPSMGDIQPTSGSIKPFSSDVLRGSKGKKPAGYDTTKQTLARMTERYINSGAKPEKAVNMAKDEMLQRNRKKVDLMSTWKRIARTDPSKAREMTSRVPKRLSTKEYIPLRAHQLFHQGKAADLKNAARMALAENDEELARKRKYNYKHTSRQKKL